MNPLANVADGLVALATLIALLCLFYGPWQGVCTDISRQIIFERRDRLFDMARAGRIDFSSDAYRAARQALNGLLRFAHKLTWQEFVISVYFVKHNNPKIPDWRDKLATLPPDVRKEIDDLVRECSAMLTAMMALKSIFIGPLVFIVALFVACTKGSTWMLRLLASQERFDPLNEQIQNNSAEFAETEFAAAA